jgi:hypothetical protein
MYGDGVVSKEGDDITRLDSYKVSCFARKTLRTQRLTDRQRVMFPFHSPPHWISLAVQEHSHCTSSGIARHQELIFARDHHDIRIRLKVEYGGIYLTDR